MNGMSESTTPAVESGEQRRPVRLGRVHSTGMDAMLRRILPDAVEDDGVSPIDVCSFNSSL